MIQRTLSSSKVHPSASRNPPLSEDIIRQTSAALAIVAIGVAGLHAVVARPKSVGLTGAASVAFEFLQPIEHEAIDEFLRRTRPAPLASNIRTLVIAQLQTAGNAEPMPQGRVKLHSAERVLDYHECRDTLEFRVIDIGYVLSDARSVGSAHFCGRVEAR